MLYIGVDRGAQGVWNPLLQAETQLHQSEVWLLKNHALICSDNTTWSLKYSQNSRDISRFRIKIGKSSSFRPVCSFFNEEVRFYEKYGPWICNGIWKSKRRVSWRIAYIRRKILPKSILGCRKPNFPPSPFKSHLILGYHVLQVFIPPSKIDGKVRKFLILFCRIIVATHRESRFLFCMLTFERLNGPCNLNIIVKFDR